MNQPSLDELMEKVDSRYTLVVLVAKRARMLTEEKNKQNGKQDASAAVKPVTQALQEVARGEVSFRRTRHGLK